jgi:hypothetical protein
MINAFTEPVPESPMTERCSWLCLRSANRKQFMPALLSPSTTAQFVPLNNFNDTKRCKRCG